MVLPFEPQIVVPRREVDPHYRPDIDGLRAVAVLAVIGFHAFPSYIPGGFVGVDVFFVISGFLISTILFRALERGTFSFLWFYRQRVRRIFPALIVVLATCLAAGGLTLFTLEYLRLGKHVAGGAAFLSNFVLWGESGYFDTAAQTKPLLHLWSLGIEEQFYIVWPLLLYLTWRHRVRSLAFLTMLMVASFTLSVLPIGTAAAAFYSPLTRIWELAAGSILAGLARGRPAPAALTPATRGMMAAIGLVAIAAAIAWLDPDRRYPGWWALLPVVGTCLAIAAGPDAWPNRWLLSWRAVVTIGLISFPLYLWHWPVLTFYRIVAGQAPSVEVAVYAIAASLVLATITYLAIERPIRFGMLPAAKTFLPLVAAMTVVGAAGGAVFLAKGFPFRTSGFDDIIAAQTDFDGGVWGKTNGDTIDTLENTVYAVGQPGADITVLLGDSVMQQYVARVRQLADQRVIDLDHNQVVFAICGGLPIPDVLMEGGGLCEKLRPRTFAALNDNRIKTVAIAALWTNHFMFAGLYFRSIGPDHNIRTSAAVREQTFQHFEAFLSRLVQSGKRVIIILETPVGWGWVNTPEKMLPTGWARLFREPVFAANAPRKFIEDYNGETNRRLRAVAAAVGAQIIDPMDYLCDQESCPALKDGRAMYYNWNHLRSAFVREHATWIDLIFRPAPAPTPSKGAPAQ